MPASIETLQEEMACSFLLWLPLFRWIFPASLVELDHTGVEEIRFSRNLKAARHRKEPSALPNYLRSIERPMNWQPNISEAFSCTFLRDFTVPHLDAGDSGDVK